MADYEIINPDPQGTVASLRALGYSIAAAVADLVDNSLAAQATTIDVAFTWAGADSWAAVRDNGSGMSEDVLRRAMTVAGLPASERASTDLGRFGMGLKTASFSQASELVVASRTDGADPWTVRCWDLDLVTATGEWRLLTAAPPASAPILSRLRAVHSGRGTIVLWRRLHRFASIDVEEGDEKLQQQFYEEARGVQAYLGMIFQRFIEGRTGRRLTVNERLVEAWDPFMADVPATTRLAPEVLPIGAFGVEVQPFVLPARNRFASEADWEAAGGQAGWLDQQGFYVYRRNRLILAGSWLGLRRLRRDDKYSLARIAVNIPSELDRQWAIDVRKASVVPPVALRPALRRIAEATRQSAREVLTRRGRVGARVHSDDLSFAWRIEQRDGHLLCRINRTHPLVAQLLRGAPEQRADTQALLRLLEETVPSTALRVMHDPATSVENDPFAEAATTETVEVARRIVAALVEQGLAPREAQQRLRTMDPFDRLQGFWQQ